MIRPTASVDDQADHQGEVLGRARADSAAGQKLVLAADHGAGSGADTVHRLGALAGDDQSPGAGEIAALADVDHLRDPGAASLDQADKALHLTDALRVVGDEGLELRLGRRQARLGLLVDGHIAGVLGDQEAALGVFGGLHREHQLLGGLDH